MLTLALLRHAKSSWDDPAEDDFDRGLNARGKSAAPEAGKVIAGLCFVPSLILCSSARRTRETLDLALPALKASGAEPQVVFDDKLYLASQVTLLEIVRDIAEAHTRVLVIGHNPGLHALAMLLAGHGEATAIEALSDRFPTCALALMTFGRERWRDVRPREGTLEAFWTPKQGMMAAAGPAAG